MRGLIVGICLVLAGCVTDSSPPPQPPPPPPPPKPIVYVPSDGRPYVEAEFQKDVAICQEQAVQEANRVANLFMTKVTYDATLKGCMAKFNWIQQR